MEMQEAKKYTLPKSGWRLHVDEVDDGRCNTCQMPAVVWVSFNRYEGLDADWCVGRHYCDRCFGKIRIDFVSGAITF